MHDAIANSALEGYQPDAVAIERLVAFTAGELTMAQYKNQVLSSVDVPHKAGEPS
ncbi:antitoxin VbhA family protein [Mycobacterium avium]